jgi:2'-5' RNA ligase
MASATASEAGRAPGRGVPQARVFFALWPDALIAARLHAAGGEAQARCGGRRMRRDTLHLTLAFVGEVAPERVPELVAIGDTLAAAPFTLCIDRLGGWRHNRIAWAGAQAVPEALAALAAGLAEALRCAGFPTERRAFAPHITLLRRIETDLVPCGIGPIEWRAERIALVRSQRDAEGARYEIVAAWPVGAAP